MTPLDSSQVMRSECAGDGASITRRLRKRTGCRPLSSMISSTPVRRLRKTIWTMSARERSSRRPRRLIPPAARRAASGERRAGDPNPARCSRLAARHSRRQIVAFQDAIQDPVDELRRLLRAEFLGDLDGLIDDDQLWRVGLVQELVDGHADDVAIDHRHPRQPPVVRLLDDHLVDLRKIVHRSLEDPGGELARARLRFLQVFERGDDGFRRVAGEIVLVEHLQRKLARFSPGAHAYSSLVRSTRHRFAISIAASAASQPLFDGPRADRSTACSCVLQVMTPKAMGKRASTATRDDSTVTWAAINSKCGVSPRSTHPRVTTASKPPRATTMRASVGISNAPGTRRTVMASSAVP